MKKFGFLIFIAAIFIGVFFSGLFPFDLGFGGAAPSVFDLDVSVNGSGNIMTQKRNVGDFTEVAAGGVFEVSAVSGKEFSLEVEADDNLLPYIETAVENGVLHISTTEKLSSGDPLKIRITAPAIERVEASGVAKFIVNGISGDVFKAAASGASKITAAGSAETVDVEVSGASKFDGTELSTINAEVETGGSGRVLVNASNILNATATGASSVRYIGEPSSVRSNVSGVSSVRKN